MPVFWDTVIAKFNAEDTRLMLERINTALTTGQEAVPLAWRNDTSGASGTATPLNRLRCNELDRRRVKITNRLVRRRANRSGGSARSPRAIGRWSTRTTAGDRATRAGLVSSQAQTAAG